MTLFNVVLNPAVVRRNRYSPSHHIQARLQEMWKKRKPHLIGSVSEEIAEEILEGGALEYDRTSWALTCVSIKDFAPATSWRPVSGVRCDDLMTTATSQARRMFFVTEVKGTTLQRGISRAYIAKMYYQVPPTRRVLCEKVMECAGELVGGISCEIDHLRHGITINVLAPESSLIA